MSEGDGRGNGRKSARGPCRKGAKKEIDQVGSKTKRSCYLSARAEKILSVHAAMEGVSRSHLIEGLVMAHLRRYVVSDRGASDPPRRRGDPDAEGTDE